MNTRGNLIFYVSKAQVLFEHKKVRVLRFEDLIFPCAKLGSGNDYDWKVMTVLTWDMVEKDPQVLNSFYRPHIVRETKLVKRQAYRAKRKVQRRIAAAAARRAGQQ